MNDQTDKIEPSMNLQNVDNDQGHAETAEFPTMNTEISGDGYDEDSEPETGRINVEPFNPMENSAISNMYRSIVTKSNHLLRTSLVAPKLQGLQSASPLVQSLRAAKSSNHQDVLTEEDEAQNQVANELSLLRVFTFGQLTVIIICFLLYLNYLLLGEFFFVFFLAFVTSVALQNSRNKLVKLFLKAIKEPTSLVETTIVYKTYYDLTHLGKAFEYIRAVIWPVENKRNATIFNDVYLLARVTIIYFFVSKVKFSTTIQIVPYIVIFEFGLKAIAIGILYIWNRIGVNKKKVEKRV